MKLRVGLIGCGWFSHFYAKTLSRIGDRIHLVWVADTDPGKAAVLSAKTNAQPLTDFREGLEDVDAVFILLPHHLHHGATLECLNAGKHVLLEKPIAVSLQQADEMIQAAEVNRRTFMIAYPHRYRVSMQLFRQIIESGRYGRLFMLDAMMDESLKGYTTGWIAKRETLGGGVFFSSSPHMLDVMFWLGGEVQSISMAGTHAGCDMEGEDTAVSVMRFKNGVIGVTRHLWASPKSRIWYTLNAVCEKAHLTLTTTPLGDLVSEGADCEWQTRIVAIGDTTEVLHESGEGLELQGEIEHFHECIKTGRTPETDGQTARDLIARIFEAYDEASAKGANVF